MQILKKLFMNEFLVWHLGHVFALWRGGQKVKMFLFESYKKEGFEMLLIL